jgi:hypothetical protein
MAPYGHGVEFLEMDATDLVKLQTFLSDSIVGGRREVV